MACEFPLRAGPACWALFVALYGVRLLLIFEDGKDRNAFEKRDRIFGVGTFIYLEYERDPRAQKQKQPAHLHMSPLTLQTPIMRFPMRSPWRHSSRLIGSGPPRKPWKSTNETYKWYNEKQKMDVDGSENTMIRRYRYLPFGRHPKLPGSAKTLFMPGTSVETSFNLAGVRLC